MAIPTVVGVGTAAASTGNVTPGLPSGITANDILILVIETNDTGVITVPSGYAHVTGSPVVNTSGAGTTLGVLWRRATASNPAPTITDTGDHTLARMIAVRGCITTGNPWNVIATGTDPGTVTQATIPGATTTVNECLVLAILGHVVDLLTTPQISNWANSSLTSVTERMDDWTDLGDGGGIGMASGGKATAGTYNSTTATVPVQPQHTTGAMAYLSMALAPVPGAVTGGYIFNSVSDTTTNTVFSVQSYNELGIPSTNKIATVQAVGRASVAASSTGATAVAIKAVTNPADAAEYVHSMTSTVAGTEPTGWSSARGPVVYAPAVTRATRPTVRIGKRTAATRVAMVDLVGLYVEHAPVLGGAVGILTETDLPLAITKRKRRATGLPSSSDTTLPLRRVKIKSSGQPIQSNTALAISVKRAFAVGQATQTNTALSVSIPKVRLVAQAVETEQALAPTHSPGSKTLIVEQASAIDSTFAISKQKQKAVVQASVTDTSLATASHKQRSVAQTEDTSSALTLAGLAKQIAVGIAEETHDALAVSASAQRTVELSSSADEALAIALARTYPVNFAESADEGLPMVHVVGGAQIIPVGFVAETNGAYEMTPVLTLEVLLRLRSIKHTRRRIVIGLQNSQGIHLLTTERERTLATNWESPAKIDLSIWRGATFRKRFIVYGGGRVTPNLTGYTALFEARDEPEGAIFLVLETITGPNGTLDLVASANTTANITRSAGVYDLTLTAPDGETSVLTWGNVAIRGI